MKTILHSMARLVGASALAVCALAPADANAQIVVRKDSVAVGRRSLLSKPIRGDLLAIS